MRIVLGACVLLTSMLGATEGVRENLDRGLVAIPTGPTSVYVGWRLLTSDAEDVAFNVYRTSGQERPVRLNNLPVSQTTDFIDTSVETDKMHLYHVRSVRNGKEGAPSASTWAVPSDEPVPYIGLKLNGDHDFQKAAFADLDGNGRYDIIIKQPNTNIDPYGDYWRRSEGTYKLEAYRDDGTFLWRHDLGWSIERGIWYSPYVVYDFDGDGKAEVAVKTGEGDPRGADGKVVTGPEYLTVLDGMSGRVVTRAPWPSRDLHQDEWSYSAFSSRNQIGLAYLDGKTPSVLVERGTYAAIVVDAYALEEGRLEKIWRWNNKNEPREYWGQGAHWMHGADVDEDGREEVVIGSAVIDDDGTSLWSTGLRHPDHSYVGDIDPERPGLKIYYGIETASEQNGMCLVDAKTGRILWGHDEPTKHIHTKGLCADIDPNHPGAECYSGERDFKDKRWLRNSKGQVLSTKDIWGLGPYSAYWDADPQREILYGANIAKLGGEPIPPRIQGRTVTVADMLGDWREEIIVSVPGAMRIYTTTIPATDRRVCLMQDPIYRNDVAMASSGYHQIPMTSYDLASQANADE